MMLTEVYYPSVSLCGRGRIGVISDLRGEIQIAVFKNHKKQTENQPDYDILLSEPKEKEK